jgi:hypothetical protein
MITPEKAFEIARLYSVDELSPIAYDAGEYWLFEYGGDCDDDGIDDAWPVIVSKKTGKTDDVTYFDKEYKEIWDNIGTFPAVELNLNELQTSPAKKA